MCLGIVAVGLLVARPADALEEKATVELGVGYAGIPGNDNLPNHGLQFSALGGWGWRGPWTLRGALSYSYHFDDQPLHVGIATAEVLYALEIVRCVPFAGLGVDGLLTVRDGNVGGDFGLSAVLGVDFLATPRWLVGLDVRGIWIPTKVSSDLDPFYLSATLRAGLIFDLRR